MDKLTRKKVENPKNKLKSGKKSNNARLLTKTTLKSINTFEEEKIQSKDEAEITRVEIKQMIKEMFILEGRLQSRQIQCRKAKKRGERIYEDEKHLEKITRKLNIFKTLQPKFASKCFWDFAYWVCLQVLSSEKYEFWFYPGDTEFIFYTCLFISAKLIFDMSFMSLKQFSVVFGISRKLILNTEFFICVEITSLYFGKWLRERGYIGEDGDKDAESLLGF